MKPLRLSAALKSPAIRFILPIIFVAAGVWLVWPETPATEIPEGEQPIVIKEMHGRMNLISSSGRCVRLPGKHAYGVHVLDASHFERRGIIVCGNPDRGIGVLNRKLEFIVKPRWNEVSVDSDGRILARDDKESSLFDADGHVLETHLVDPQDRERRQVGHDRYVIPMGMSEWVPSRMRLNGAATFVSSPQFQLETGNGDPVGSRHWHQIGNFDSRGLASVSITNGEEPEKFGCINLAGEVVIEPVWNSPIEFDDHGWACATCDDGCGWIDRSGKVVVPLQWESVTPFSRSDSSTDAVALVKQNNKWGGIDRSGKVHIPFTFDQVPTGYSTFGLACVGIGADPETKWGWIDAAGNAVAPLQWNDCDPFMDDGLAIVRGDAGIGMVDQHGKEILPPRFLGIQRLDKPIPDEKAANLFAGAALVAVDEDSTHVFNRTGKRLTIVDGSTQTVWQPDDEHLGVITPNTRIRARLLGFLPTEFLWYLCGNDLEGRVFRNDGVCIWSTHRERDRFALGVLFFGIALVTKIAQWRIRRKAAASQQIITQPL